MNKADLTRSDPKTSDLMRNEWNGCVRDPTRPAARTRPRNNLRSMTKVLPGQVPGPADRTGFNHPGVFELDLILV